MSLNTWERNYDEIMIKLSDCHVWYFDQLFMLMLSQAGSSDLGSKWVRFAPNGTNRGLFEITFQYILARCERKCIEK